MVVTIVETLGQRIVRLRKEKGWTASLLAMKAGISKSYLSDIENDKDKNPSAVVIQKIAGALGVNTDYLLGTTNVPSPLPPPEHDEEVSEEDLLVRSHREDRDYTDDEIDPDIMEKLIDLVKEMRRRDRERQQGS